MNSRWSSISGIATNVQAGKTKAIDMVEQALDAIDENKSFNAVIALIHERAVARSKDIDNRVKKGEKA